MASALLVVTLLAAVTGADTLATPGWARLADRPTEADLDCASYDHHHQWSVALRDGEAVVALAERHVERQDPLPFAVPKHHDRSGERHVLPTSDGWLVGFDAGEFGGGLWFTATGEDWRRIRPGAGAPAHPEDPFKAENVHGLVVVGEQPMVLMGLDHLGGRSGRVFTLTLRDGEWTLDRAAVLDSSPEAWQVVDGHLEVVTEAGLWVVQSDATARLAVPVNFSMAMPRSFAVDADGRRYIGMRRYVLILEPDSPAWRETWYGPPGCPHSRRKNAWKCVCVK